jgi:AcrR family transcriptional regulator
MHPSPSARRAQILDAAERLFRHYGPGKTTIGDIAREARIGVGSVYLEFASKDEIVAELARRRHDRVIEAMRSAAHAGGFAQRLSAALEARVEALFELAAQGAHACDLVLCGSRPVEKAYGQFRQSELAFVRDLIEAGVRSGEFAPQDPELTAQLVQRAYASLSPPWLFEHERQAALGAVRAMNALLLHGIAARTSRVSSRQLSVVVRATGLRRKRPRG